MRISLLPEFEGDAVRFEDFFSCVGAEVSPPLIRCSRVPEQSSISSTGESMEPAPGDADKIEHAFNRGFDERNGDVPHDFPTSTIDAVRLSFSNRCVAKSRYQHRTPQGHQLQEFCSETCFDAVV
jgi:hypothetical protein